MLLLLPQSIKPTWECNVWTLNTFGGCFCDIWMFLGCSTKETNKDNIVVEMKSDNTEEAVLLGVNGEKQPLSD